MDEKSVCPCIIPYNGTAKGPIRSKCFLNDLKKLGYPKVIESVIVRHDPESALSSLVEATKNGFEGSLIIQKFPKGVKESKGEIKRAVQSVECQSRTLRAALEASYQEKLPDDTCLT